MSQQLAGHPAGHSQCLSCEGSDGGETCERIPALRAETDRWKLQPSLAFYQVSSATSQDIHQNHPEECSCMTLKEKKILKFFL